MATVKERKSAGGLSHTSVSAGARADWEKARQRLHIFCMAHAVRVADMLQESLPTIGSDHCKDIRGVSQSSGSTAALLAPARTAVPDHVGHIDTGHSQARAESCGGGS